MNPPPPRNPARDSETEPVSQSDESSAPTMKPPPPRNPNPPDLDSTEVVNPELNEETKEDSVSIDSKITPHARASKQSPVPYTIPEWSGPPCHRFQLEVLKEGAIVDHLDVHEKGAYLFGRDVLCDFALEHPSISRFHAVIQYKRSGVAYLFDLGSTHGTLINKNKVDKRVYVDLHVGDVIRFGGSTRLYIFQGPSELMPPEKDLQLMREAKLRREMSEREASLRRARQQAAMADGVSWGMGDDAIEEEEDNVEEITWQTYTGELTPKQEKTKDKVLKRLEKIGHMKKEIAAIRAKDISQGGLTQGQQTQIARNDQRIAELLEELETLEETLNDSIRESLGAKTGRKPKGKKKGPAEDEEDFSSDEDDFYDRTKKKPATQEGSESQTVETVDSLLEKRDKVLKEIEKKNEELSTEKNKMETETVTEVATGDSLDAYMTGLSSTLVQDKTAQIQQELSTLHSELDRILYLLKVADPTGEEIKKRELKSQEPKVKKSEIPPEEKKKSVPLKPADPDENKEKEVDKKDVVDSSSKAEVETKASETAEEKKTTVFVPTKPQWLGSSANKDTVEEKKPEIVAAATATDSTDDGDGFVDYKDRKTMIEGATGLIIRKRKQKDESKEEDENSKEKQAEVMAQDAVALLLKHSVGHHRNEEDGEVSKKEESRQESGRSRKKKKTDKKVVLGPDKPEYLDESTDYDSSWVPPKGQSGDGRTSLNDRLGY